jgi:hypothetical protein
VYLHAEAELSPPGRLLDRCGMSLPDPKGVRRECFGQVRRGEVDTYGSVGELPSSAAPVDYLNNVVVRWSFCHRPVAWWIEAHRPVPPATVPTINIRNPVSS